MKHFFTITETGAGCGRMATAWVGKVVPGEKNMPLFIFIVRESYATVLLLNL